MASSDPIDLNIKQLQFHELPLLVLLGHHMKQHQPPWECKQAARNTPQSDVRCTVLVWCLGENRAGERAGTVDGVSPWSREVDLKIGNKTCPEHQPESTRAQDRPER
jgi:hypothetical protein